MPNAIPPSAILLVSSKFIKAISAIRSKKNIDADGFTIQIDRADNLIRVCHEQLSNVKVIYNCRHYSHPPDMVDMGPNLPSSKPLGPPHKKRPRISPGARH